MSLHKNLFTTEATEDTEVLFVLCRWGSEALFLFGKNIYTISIVVSDH